MTALELTSYQKQSWFDPDPVFKVKGGSVLWEAISVKSGGRTCLISRLVESGGKPFLMGMRYQSRYIKSDTEVIIVPAED